MSSLVLYLDTVGWLQGAVAHPSSICRDRFERTDLIQGGRAEQSPSVLSTQALESSEIKDCLFSGVFFFFCFCFSFVLFLFLLHPPLM